MVKETHKQDLFSLRLVSGYLYTIMDKKELKIQQTKVKLMKAAMVFGLVVVGLLVIIIFKI